MAVHRRSFVHIVDVVDGDVSLLSMQKLMPISLVWILYHVTVTERQDLVEYLTEIWLRKHTCSDLH